MKKAVILILVCILLLCLTACSSPLFESRETMLAHINGLWLVDDTYTPTYYYFKDRQVYRIYEQSFEYDVESYFDSMIENGELEALCRQDFDAVINAITPESIIGKPLSNVQIVYEKNTIILDQGTSSELRFIITKQSTPNSGDGDKTAASEELIVVVQTPNSAIATPITKISDDPDFSGEYFAQLYNEVREDYTISTADLLTDAKEYADMVIDLNYEVQYWDLITQNDDTTHYSSSKWVTSMSGDLLITNDSVSFAKEVPLVNNEWISFNPFFSVYYNKSNGTITIIDKDNMSLNMMLLYQYAARAFYKFPGSADQTEVFKIIDNEIANNNYVVEDGAIKVSKNINGIDYSVMLTTDGMGGAVTAKAPESLRLSEIIDYLQVQEDSPVPEQNQPTPTQPEETEPAPTVPMNEVPYTTSLGAAVSILDGPSNDASYVQSIGQDGIYTIVEEAYDDEGNLWGKLKSGLGWVLLEEAYTASGRTCPQCGLSEPDAIFTEDWQPGDPCFGCSYNNFHGGEDGKKYCSECGADCTYRGLEEDGRCEDCYFGN